MTTQVFKIVLVGESGVGKTSIIKQFIDHTFKDNILSSVGGSFCSKNLIYEKNKILKLEIWDTAGQERFRALTRMFYSDANACILVYDITQKESFEELKNYWIEQVREKADKNIILAIAGNKSDLIENEEVDEGEARKLAESIDAIFMSISAKYINVINDLFLEIAKKHLGVEDVELKDDNEKSTKEDNNNDNNNKRDDTVKLSKPKEQKNNNKNCC